MKKIVKAMIQQGFVKAQFAFCDNEPAVKNRPFVTLNADATLILFFEMFRVALASPEKKVDVVFTDKRNGEEWVLLFERSQYLMSFQERVARSLFLMRLLALTLLGMGKASLDIPIPTVDELATFLADTLEREPCPYVNLLVRFPKRYEEWRFLLIKKERAVTNRF